MSDEWYVARRGPDGNKRYGPVPLQQLREMLDAGKVQGEDLVWCEGMAGWERADRCESLVARPRRGSPPDDRRYADGPRGYPREDDDRPYRRRPPPRQSSSGWIVAVVVGGVLAVCFLGCGGLVLYGMLRAPSTPASYTTVPTTGFSKFEEKPPDIRNDGAMVNADAPAGDLGQVIPYDPSRLYYTDHVDLNEARDLGDYLSQKGYFPADHGATVQLDKDAVLGTYQVRFCVRDGAPWNDDTIDFYRTLRAQVQEKVFAPSDVEVHLCDGQMNTVRTLRAGD